MRFNNLQILRFFASGGVVLVHLAIAAGMVFRLADDRLRWLMLPWLASFWVPVFFALSGFVLTHALQSSTPGRYLVLRAARLYPGYWLAVAAVVVLAWAGAWPAGYPFAPDPSLSSILLLPVVPTRAGQRVLVVEWTLVYEMFLSASLLGLWCVAGRRRLPAAVCFWLVVIAVKAVVKPGYGSYMQASWKSIPLSAHVVPFLLGVLAYHLRDRGRRWRWPALAAAVGLIVAAAKTADTDTHCWLSGWAAALAVWFLTKVPDVSARNPLVRAGGYSYGLYLLHFPAIVFGFQALTASGVLAGTWAGVAVVGAFALVLGSAFGWLELSLYGRLKKRLDRRPAIALPRLSWRGRLAGHRPR